MRKVYQTLTPPYRRTGARFQRKKFVPKIVPKIVPRWNFYSQTNTNHQNCPEICPQICTSDLRRGSQYWICALFLLCSGKKISGTICGQIWEQFSGQFFSFGIGLLDNDPINPIWIVVDLLKMALVSDKLSTSIKWSLGKTSWDDDWTNRWEWANHSKPNF